MADETGMKRFLWRGSDGSQQVMPLPGGRCFEAVLFPAAPLSFPRPVRAGGAR